MKRDKFITIIGASAVAPVLLKEVFSQDFQILSITWCIDQQKCNGCELCVNEEPEIFGMHEEGYAEFIHPNCGGGGAMCNCGHGSELSDRIRNVADMCKVEAITECG